MGIRVAPDNNDLVVWKLDELTAPFVNSSTSTSAPSHPVSDLATVSGTMQFRQPSPFAATGTNTSVLFTATNSSSPRNFISGANNFEPAFPMTVSAWIYVRSYNTTGLVQHIFNKQNTAGVWSGGTFGVITMQNQSVGSATYAISLNVTGTVAYWTMPLNMWCHVGVVYDGSTTKNYLNGNLVQQWASSGAINYGGHGPWFFGAIPAGSGNPEESAVSICDVRVANVARAQAYFQNIYNLGGTTSGLGVPFSIYYKLRAFDLSCSEPTPVYWVSTSISYANAPTAPCGSLATLGPIEIMDQWGIIG